MKISKTRLKEIIKEEFKATISENSGMPPLRQKWFKLRSQSDRDPSRRAEHLIATAADELIKLVSEYSKFEGKYQAAFGDLQEFPEEDKEVLALKNEAIADVQDYLKSVEVPQGLQFDF